MSTARFYEYEYQAEPYFVKLRWYGRALCVSYRTGSVSVKPLPDESMMTSTCTNRTVVDNLGSRHIRSKLARTSDESDQMTHCGSDDSSHRCLGGAKRQTPPRRAEGRTRPSAGVRPSGGGWILATRTRTRSTVAGVAHARYT
eukprot:scaffold99163_cov41-Prasinocladus_malaysianus.AAC.2